MNETLAVAASKTVIVYSTVGNNMKSVSTTANTWGQLKQELSNQGVNVDGMKVIEGRTQVTLDSPEALLPESDFKLFLLPEKVKSGFWDNEDDDDDDDDYDNEPVRATQFSKEQILAKLSDIESNVQQVRSWIEGSIDPQNPEHKAIQDEAARIVANLGRL